MDARRRRADGVHAARAWPRGKRRRAIARTESLQSRRVRRRLQRGRDSGKTGGRHVSVRRARRRLSLRRPVSAISNVCQHQNGPLGEGRIVNGCVVCPWHGYEYLPDTGASPPPFTEKVPTFDVRVVAGRVLVHPQPHPPGTRVQPAMLDVGPEGLRMWKPERRRVLYRLRAADAASARRGSSARVVIGLGCLVVIVAVTLAAGPRAGSRAAHSSSDTRRASAGQSSSARIPVFGSMASTRTSSPGRSSWPRESTARTPWCAGWRDVIVTLTGTRIQRGAHTMIEVEPASLRSKVSEAASVEATALLEQSDKGAGGTDRGNRGLEMFSRRDGPRLRKDAQGVCVPVPAGRHSSRPVRPGSSRPFVVAASGWTIRRADWCESASSRR